MSFDKKTPYYSSRVRVADVTSPKQLVGTKEFTVEVTFGNQDTKRIIKNRDDVADIEDKTIFDVMDELFEQRDKWGKKKGFVFVDKVVKYKGDES